MNLILIVCALLCELVAALTGFDVLIHASNVLGWLALGLVFYLASHLVGERFVFRRPE